MPLSLKETTPATNKTLYQLIRCITQVQYEHCKPSELLSISTSVILTTPGELTSSCGFSESCSSPLSAFVKTLPLIIQGIFKPYKNPRNHNIREAFEYTLEMINSLFEQPIYLLRTILKNTNLILQQFPKTDPLL